MRDDEPKRAVLSIDLSVRTALVAVATIFGVWLLIQIWQVLVVVVVALMLVGMLNPVVERLEARGLRRSHGIALVFVGLLLLVAGLGMLTLPTLGAQLSDLVEHFPEAQARLVRQLEQHRLLAPIADSVREFSPNDLAARARTYGVTYAPRAVEIGAYGVSAFFLALYIVIDRDRMRGSLFAVVPRHYHVRLSRILINLETIVGGYMRGQAITSALMALVTFTVLAIAGVPNALALALFAGLTDVLPYIGALLACGPAFLVALSKGFTVALVVLGILAAYQELESRVIIPRIYGRVLRLPAATVLIALLVGGKLLGILGAVLALPIAAAIRMILAELRVELPGEDVNDAALREKDAAAEAEFEARAAGLPAREAATIATEIAASRESDEGTPKKEGKVAPLTSGSPKPA